LSVIALYLLFLKDYLAPPQLLSSIRLWLVLFVSTHYSILSNAQEPTYVDTLSDIVCVETSRMFGNVGSVGSYISDWKELDSGLDYRYQAKIQDSTVALVTAQTIRSWSKRTMCVDYVSPSPIVA
jgi:hypothetical protein